MKWQQVCLGRSLKLSHLPILLPMRPSHSPSLSTPQQLHLSLARSLSLSNNRPIRGHDHLVLYGRAASRCSWPPWLWEGVFSRESSDALRAPLLLPKSHSWLPRDPTPRTSFHSLIHNLKVCSLGSSYSLLASRYAAPQCAHDGISIAN